MSIDKLQSFSRKIHNPTEASILKLTYLTNEYLRVLFYESTTNVPKKDQNY